MKPLVTTDTDRHGDCANFGTHEFDAKRREIAREPDLVRNYPDEGRWGTA